MKSEYGEIANLLGDAERNYADPAHLNEYREYWLGAAAAYRNCLNLLEGKSPGTGKPPLPFPAHMQAVKPSTRKLPPLKPSRRKAAKGKKPGKWYLRLGTSRLGNKHSEEPVAAG